MALTAWRAPKCSGRRWPEISSSMRRVTSGARRWTRSRVEYCKALSALPATSPSRDGSTVWGTMSRSC